MKKNVLKDKIMVGVPVWGVSFTFKSLQLVELSAKLGFDYVFIEGEHGALSLRDIEDICIVADALGMGTVARVPRLDPETILGYLDRGVMGIRAPHVSSGREADLLVQSCKFSPRGIRSLSKSRAAEYQQPDDLKAYMSHCDNEILTIAMVEDVQALADLSAILSTDGLDVITIGPFDLSQSMGEAGPESPRVFHAIKEAAEKIRASGKLYERDYFNHIDALDLYIKGARDFLKNRKK